MMEFICDLALSDLTPRLHSKLGRDFVLLSVEPNVRIKPVVVVHVRLHMWSFIKGWGLGSTHDPLTKLNGDGLVLAFRRLSVS